MEIYHSILRRCAQGFFREKLAPLHLKPVDGIVIRSISQYRSCNQETICCAADLDKGRIARSMGRLEERGLIRRVVNPQNKREKQVELTDEGGKILEQIRTFEEDWKSRCFSGFTEEEIKNYQSYLERMARNALSEKEAWKHD